MRHLIQSMLTRHGYRVIEAVDGEDAVDKFDRNKGVGLLILDSVMPRMNGRQVYDVISAGLPGIKVLFISGYTRDVVLDKGIEEKRFDFLSKPLTANDLLHKVREILDRPDTLSVQTR